MKALCSILKRIFAQTVRILLGTTLPSGERLKTAVPVQERLPKQERTPKLKKQRVKVPKKATKAETSPLMKASSL